MTLEDYIMAGIGLIISGGILAYVGIKVKSTNAYFKDIVHTDEVPKMIEDVINEKLLSKDLIKGEELNNFRAAIENDFIDKEEMNVAVKESYDSSIKYTDSHIGGLREDHRELHKDMNNKFETTDGKIGGVHDKIDEKVGEVAKEIGELKTLIIQTFTKGTD